MILTECAKFSKPLTLCDCERCSQAETNSQRGSDIRSRGSEDRSGEKWLQLSLLAGLQDVPWIRRERERGWVTYFARRSAPLATQPSSSPCAEIDKKKCAGHRSTPIYEQSSAPPLKAPRGLQGGPLQSESIHSSLDIFKGSGHQKSESVFREFILRLELLSANYITTHLKLLSYSFECL